MTLTELQQEVYTLTNRPDLTTLTLSAIKRATLRAHQSEYYYKDIYEVGIDFQTPAYIHDLEYQTVIPRWRAASYFRVWDSSTKVTGKFFEIIDPLSTVDDYLVDREYVAYSGGAIFHLRARVQFQQVLCGCYLHPIITTEEYDSWIAKDYPFVIILDAVSLVFKAIGKDDEAAMMKVQLAEEMASLKTSNIQSMGY